MIIAWHETANEQEQTIIATRCFGLLTHYWLEYDGLDDASNAGGRSKSAKAETAKLEKDDVVPDVVLETGTDEVFLQAESDREEETITLDPVRADVKALDDKTKAMEEDVQSSWAWWLIWYNYWRLPATRRRTPGMAQQTKVYLIEICVRGRFEGCVRHAWHVLFWECLAALNLIQWEPYKDKLRTTGGRRTPQNKEPRESFGWWPFPCPTLTAAWLVR